MAENAEGHRCLIFERSFQPDIVLLARVRSSGLRRQSAPTVDTGTLDGQSNSLVCRALQRPRHTRVNARTEIEGAALDLLRRSRDPDRILQRNPPRAFGGLS